MVVERFLCAVVVVTGLAAGRATAAPENTSTSGQPVAAPAGVVVLDTRGFWRMYHTFKPPLIQWQDGLRPLLTKIKWLDWETPEVPAGWTATAFDDGDWARFPLGRAAGTPYLSRLCLRGKFQVTDPARVQGLKLSLDYHGGAMAYINGIAVARQNVAQGQADLAEAYPEEVFAEGDEKAVQLRVRRLVDVPIPARLLHRGVNVLAVEIVRAPYHEKVMTMGLGGKDPPYELAWNTCDTRWIQVVADSPEGLVPNVTRPAGFQIWNSDELAGDFDLDFGDPCEPLRPIRLVGARNGSYSGKLGVGSTRPLEELKATPSDLQGDSGGTIPAAAVRLRYGIPWGREFMDGGIYPAPEGLLGAMADAPPKIVPVYRKGLNPIIPHMPNQPPLAFRPARTVEDLLKVVIDSRSRTVPFYPKTPRPLPVFGAVSTVWTTVQVPAEARPGTYRGDITIEAKGEKPVKAPIELKVVEWTLPEPQNYNTWMEFIQSPDTLAVEYGLEPWSERHWQLIAKSFKEVGDTGSRSVYIPIIAQTNLGNEQSMVRWIKKADGTFDYDFSIMDKYLDTAEQNLGKLKLVCFVTWDIYLIQEEKPGLSAGPPSVNARKILAGKGPLVTVLDPATNKQENINLPPLADASSMAIWKPLFDQLRERLKARGLEESAALGLLSDAVPTKAEVQFFQDVSGGWPWVEHSHHPRTNKLYGLMKTVYQAHVWEVRFPDTTSLFGWTSPRLSVQYQRGGQNESAAARWRFSAEAGVAGSERGLGRLGGDFWFAVKDKTGRRIGTVASRYPQSAWRNLDLLSHFLAPGPDGPVATNRLVAVREGVEECEARIYIEQALTNKVLRQKLGDELAKRAKETLDERLLYMWKEFSNLHLSGPSNRRANYMPWRGVGVEGQAWFMSTRWQERSEKLYTLAAEVEKKLSLR
jgi:hypothetical protein